MTEPQILPPRVYADEHEEFAMGLKYMEVAAQIIDSVPVDLPDRERVVELIIKVTRGQVNPVKKIYVPPAQHGSRAAQKNPNEYITPTLKKFISISDHDYLSSPEAEKRYGKDIISKAREILMDFSDKKLSEE